MIGIRHVEELVEQLVKFSLLICLVPRTGAVFYNQSRKIHNKYIQGLFHLKAKKKPQKTNSPKNVVSKDPLAKKKFSKMKI